MTVEELQAQLDALDKGVLKSGSHAAGAGEFCALEFSHAVRAQAHSDAPSYLPDLRPLNDARWSSDQARTDALLPVMAALWDWRDWPLTRQRQWAEQVAIATVRQIIAELPGLPDAIRQRCRAAATIGDAQEAAAWAAARAAAAARAMVWEAEAAAAAAAAAAEAAARAAAAAAAEAAAAAAEAAARAAAAAADTVLQRACQIWIQAIAEVRP